MATGMQSRTGRVIRSRSHSKPFTLQRSHRFPGQYSQQRGPRGEHGYALVEAALSLVLLLTLVFGIMEVSMALYTYHFISDAAREGTRYAIVRGSACNSFPTACPASATNIQDYVRTLGFPGVDPNKMTVNTAWPTTGTSCTPSSTPCNNPGNLVQVTINYQLPFALAFVRVSTLTLTSTSQMVISQ